MGSWRADEPSPHRLHRCTHYTLCQTVRSYKTITPKMSAFGTSTPTTRPLGGFQTVWALPTPAFATWQGCRRRLRLNPCTPTTERSSPTSKGQLPLRGCFASLDRFPAPSASDRFATPKEMERGQGRRSRAFHP